MGMSPDDSVLQELSARLAREKQANEELRTKLTNAEAGPAEQPSPLMPQPQAAIAPSTPQPQAPSISRGLRLPFWLTALLVILALIVGFSVSSSLVSRALWGSPYQGKGFSIRSLPGWQTQADESGGVLLSDPHFPSSIGRRGSQVGVLVHTSSALFYEFGSSSHISCQDIGGVAKTTTINGNIWQQQQFRCLSLQNGGVATVFRQFSIVHGPAQTAYSMFFVTAVDRLEDFSNGNFDTIAQSFTFD